MLLRRFAASCLWAGLLGLCAAPALAVDEKDLLPVDRAYVLHVQAPSRQRIELRWDIAPGYYLYRHRTAVAAGPGFTAGALRMPDGVKHHDEFFGDVETYHGQLTAVLPGVADAAADTVTLEVRYQGCADAGVCYPPQKRSVTVKLPAATATADVVLPRNAGGLAGGLKLPGIAATQSLPLPEEQAFGFEAIVDDGNRLLLRFSPAPGYYLYRDRTTLALEGADGIQAGQPQWPPGQTRHDEHFGDVVVYFDQIEVPLPLRRQRATASAATLAATFQGCQTDGVCYPPMTRRVKLSLPAGKVSPGADTTAAPPLVQPLPDAQAAPPAANTGDIAVDVDAENALRSQPPAAAGSSDSLPWVLLLALAGGLILNLMPCVLPVLSLKVLGLAQSGESRQHARRHALWYTLGVLAAFATVGAVVLALRAAGHAVKWGFQLQQPGFVAAMVYLMFVVGLSLSGVFTLGGNWSGIGQSLANRKGATGDFFTGVLACVVASPCIGPFMGLPLGYAFTAPPRDAMLIFLMLGLGLALPFLLIGLIPALARWLPRPGAWMETFKQVLAFPMYLTAIWLLHVLGKQRGIDAMALMLAGATMLALGLWWFECSRWRSRRVGMVLSAVLIALALAPAWSAVGERQPVDEVDYSPALLEQLRAENRVVFVNMTADWCITCKANERLVLDRDAFRAALKHADAVYMHGDWTDVNPQISAFLEQHKAVGVPLYVVYGPGAPPQVLPTVLTQSIVDDALARAAH